MQVAYTDASFAKPVNRQKPTYGLLPRARDARGMASARPETAGPALTSVAVTLILSLLTPDFAIHVSDRQLTDGLTGQQLVTPASKTVVVPQPQFMVSYTGLAQIGGMTTDEWLMRTIWNIREGDDFFGDLAKAATAAFATLTVSPPLKRHGFIISGWIGEGSFETDSPLPDGFTPNAYSAFVSNFLDFDAGIELHDTTIDFTHRARPLYPHERFSVFTAGVPLTPTESDELEANIAAAIRSAGGAERAAAVAMVRTIEKVAQRTSLVGGGTFICALPRDYEAPVDPQQRGGLAVMGVYWGLPEHGIATFIHIPDRPTRVVESPGIIADPFAGRAKLIVHKGELPDLAGAGEVPEEAELPLDVIALRSSEEIAQLFGNG